MPHHLALGADPRRVDRLSFAAADLHVDLSKSLLDDDVLPALLELADQVGVAQRRDAMFAGEKINITEDRAVLHVALRAPGNANIQVDGVNVVPAVHEVLGRMAEFADKIRAGRWVGHTGKPIVNIVNIGIGGSDLGPVMAYEALRHYSQRDLTFRFVSNVDGTDFAEATHDLDPAETLGLNDIGQVRLHLAAPLPVEPYAVHRRTGAFLVIDPHDGATLAAGMVRGGDEA